MKDIQELRQQLDQIDREIVALLEKRLDVSRDVARYKLARNLPVLDRAREAQVLDDRASLLREEEHREALRNIYQQIMAMSRAEQEKILQEEQKNA